MERNEESLVKERSDANLIAKFRSIPLRILMDEALERRLPVEYPKKPEIQQNIARRRAGFNGEKILDYYLSVLPENNFTFLHDLRLSNGETYFQIDTLLLSPNFVLLIEVKHITGTLFFDRTFEQLIRISKENEEKFINPVAQAERQHRQFSKWLKDHHFNVIPVDYMVVFTHPSTILKSSPDYSQLNHKACDIELLSKNIDRLSQWYKTEKMSVKEIKRLTTLLLKKHSPHRPNILKTYNLSSTDIIPGVQCSKCLALPMIRTRGKWHCPHCLASSKEAHVDALRDFALIFHPTITNYQLRNFLRLESSYIAKYLLDVMQLPFTGKNKGRIYNLEDLINEIDTQRS
ncbi:nuclease-related domain-containing protein [Bacillus sp. T33-2]|uniref:nuclease-related domain-containing protein n=1 Tax=Bacillus sp. T33-2 TaxID=2054168 RepID=UPI000C787EE7|nr:nuclease-related domain-containing protein [Bacillus sp. T33-2]PLR96096.1 NERD nuclease [Bacillus sp. T33-2]